MSSSAAVDPTQVWIYHERQQALLCGQHALNNLAQQPVFSAGRLSEIAHQLDQIELNVWAQNSEGGTSSRDYLQRLSEGSNNVDAQGNFSIEVLKAAVLEQFGITLPHLSQQDLKSSTGIKDITEFQGFLCHKSDHWFAIRQVGGRFWNLDSMLERPVVVSHFQLATEMEKWQGAGYTIFCVPSGLARGGIKPPPNSSGSSGGEHKTNNWHRMSDLLQGKSTEKDPWESLTGSGMRLDANAVIHGAGNGLVVEGLTEEEQLQLALQASMEPPPALASRIVSQDTVVVPPEPAAGTAGAVRIQFRLPNGTRLVRRFAGTDPVSVVYAFVRQQQPSSSMPVELKYGFPPKNLEPLYDQTIAEAGLAGESIQARYG